MEATDIQNGPDAAPADIGAPRRPAAYAEAPDNLAFRKLRKRLLRQTQEAVQEYEGSSDRQPRGGFSASGGHLRDFVYGGIDGTVTTFAIVAGVEGAGLSHKVIVALGIANVLADGFSMAAGNYTGTKAERDNNRRLRDIARSRIRAEPITQTEALRAILRRKGLGREALDMAVGGLTRNEESWVELILIEDHGLSPVDPNPIPAAAATFAAFLACGLVPLLPFLLGVPDPFAASIGATALVFLAIGAAKSRWSLISWQRSGLETLAIGSVAALIAYGVGYFVSGLTG